MKKIYKIGIITLTIIFILGITLSVQASQIIDPNDYTPNDLTTDNAGKLMEKANVIIAAIRIFGTVASVITFIVIGLRYMFASTDGRASYKETMVPYLVGAIMLFTIPNIIGIVYSLVKGMQFN